MAFDFIGVYSARLESKFVEATCILHRCNMGSIRWAVGAALGYAAAVRGKKRLILSVGDGSFQVTAQVRHVTKISHKRLNQEQGLNFCKHLLLI